MSGAPSDRRPVDVPALASSVVFALAAGFWAFLSWIQVSLRCDESCVEAVGPSEDEGHWYDYASAWQWSAQVIIAVAGFLLTLVAVHAVVKRRYERAGLLLAAAVVLFGTWSFIMFGPGA